MQDRLYNILQQIQNGILGNELKNYFNTVVATQTPIIFDGLDTKVVFDNDLNQSQAQINVSLIQKIKEKVIYFEDYVSDSTGNVDVTNEMQALLDTFEGNIYARKNSIFKTSKTLFNKKSNRTIDFQNAKIVNKTNSRYAIVTVTPNLIENTDTALDVLMTERHYGSEIKNSHIKNLTVEMLTNTSGGSNLGVGIVYGEDCTLSGLQFITTNGNAIEIRNSLRCNVYHSNIGGQRNYGCFVFMSKLCEVKWNKIKGGVRGIITKMNRDGDTFCGHRIAYNTLEDATQNGRAIVGGEWRETSLTHDIYVPNHEWVEGNEIFGNTIINTNQAQSITPGAFSGGWKIYNNIFKWNNLAGFVITIGGEGNLVAGELLKGDHEVYNNFFYDHDASTNTLFSARLSCSIHDNYFYNCKSKYWLIADKDMAGNNVEFVKFYDNTFSGVGNSVYSGTIGDHGFVARAGVNIFSFTGNKGVLKGIVNGSNTGTTFLVSSADNTYLADNNLRLEATVDVTSLLGFIVLGGRLKTCNSLNLDMVAALNNTTAIQLQAVVSVDCRLENNTYTLIGSSTTSRAVFTFTDYIDGLNSYIGSWTTKIFNNSVKPVASYIQDRQSSVIPSNGSYKKGEFIRNIAPTVLSNTVIFGWLRLIDGSNHVLNTDWVEIKHTIQ